MKKYTVTWLIKENGTHRIEGEIIEANNAKEARQIVKENIKERTGRNTFQLTARKWENGLTPEALLYEDWLNATQKNIDRFAEHGFERIVKMEKDSIIKYLDEIERKGLKAAQKENKWIVRA